LGNSCGIAEGAPCPPCEREGRRDGETEGRGGGLPRSFPHSLGLSVPRAVARNGRRSWQLWTYASYELLGRSGGCFADMGFSRWAPATGAGYCGDWTPNVRSSFGRLFTTPTGSAAAQCSDTECTENTEKIRGNGGLGATSRRGWVKPLVLDAATFDAPPEGQELEGAARPFIGAVFTITGIA
jgi:hypothetical protein